MSATGTKSAAPARKAPAAPTRAAPSKPTESKDATPTKVSVKLLKTAEEFKTFTGRGGSHVVMFFYFSNQECNSLLSELPKLAAKLPEVTFARLNMETLEDVADAHQVSGVPTFQFWKAGKKVAQEEEVKGVENVEKLVKQHCS